MTGRQLAGYRRNQTRAAFGSAVFLMIPDSVALAVPSAGLAVLARSRAARNDAAPLATCASGAEAEREGFEPSVRFPAHTLSKRAP